MGLTPYPGLARGTVAGVVTYLRSGDDSMALYCPNCGKTLAEDAAFCSGCGRSVANPAASGGAPFAYRPGLRRARAGRKIAGVCQGLANHLGWDVTVLRVLAVVLAIALFPLGIIAYLLFWLITPEEPFALPPATPMKPAM